MESRKYTFNKSTLIVKFGNIIESHSEVIVSSDDCNVTMDGGVSRAILSARGVEFIKDAQKLMPIGELRSVWEKTDFVDMNVLWIARLYILIQCSPIPSNIMSLL